MRAPRRRAMFCHFRLLRASPSGNCTAEVVGDHLWTFGLGGAIMIESAINIDALPQQANRTHCGVSHLLIRANVLINLLLMFATVSMAAQTPQVVDSIGTVVGTLGHSDAVEQGVIINVCAPPVPPTATSFGTGCPPRGFWILVPWGEQGFQTPLLGQPTPISLIGGRTFYSTPDCSGTAYMPAPSTALQKNSETHPYSIIIGGGSVALFPTGPAKSGAKLGIASSRVFGPALGDEGACEPAWATDQHFAQEGFVNLNLSLLNLLPPFSIQP